MEQWRGAFKACWRKDAQQRLMSTGKKVTLETAVRGEGRPGKE